MPKLWTPFRLVKIDKLEPKFSLVDEIKGCPIPNQKAWAASLATDDLTVHGVAAIASYIERAEQALRCIDPDNKETWQHLDKSVARLLIQFSLATLAALRHLAALGHPHAVQGLFKLAHKESPSTIPKT